MILLDFKKSRRNSFYQGFVKGLGAPYILYGAFSANSNLEVMQVQPQASSNPSQGIDGDWVRVANDLHGAVLKYGQTSKK